MAAVVHLGFREQAEQSCLLCSVVDDVALIDVAGAGKLCTARINIDVTFLVEDEVGPAEDAIVARNGITVRPWSQREFCNTFRGQSGHC